MKYHAAICSAALCAVMGVSSAAPARADVLAWWANWADADAGSGASPYVADGTSSGFAATIAHSGTSPVSGRISSSFGSTDGTFGTVAGASATTKGLLVRGQNGETTLTLTLTNNTTGAYNVESFHFDFAAREQDVGSRGLNGFTLTYVSGGLGAAGTVIATQTDLPYTITSSQDQVAENNFPDFDFNLSPVLSDIQLAAGESAVFTLHFTAPQTAYNSGISSVVDNIAFIGSVVPEPASLALMGLGGLMMAHRRRAS